MIRKLSLVLALFLAVGCASHATNTPIETAVTPAATLPSTPSIPPVDTTTWKDIKGNGWSFKAPPSFVDMTNTLSPEERSVISVALDSKSDKARVVFAVEPTELSLDEYTATFARDMVANGAQLISVRKNTTGLGMAGQDTMLLIFSIKDGSIAAMHFIAVVNGKAYNLEYGTLTGNVTKQVPTCLAMVHSVKIDGAPARSTH